MTKHFTLLLFIGLAWGQIFTTLIESSSSQFSTYKINPNSLDMEIILPSSGFSDLNEDGSKFLLIDSDSILIYDSGSTNHLHISGKNARFTNNQNLIVYSRYSQIFKYDLIDSSETLIVDYASHLGYFMLSSDKDEILYTKIQYEWGGLDSLDFILQNIETGDSISTTRVPDGHSFHWGEDDYLYYAHEGLFKVNLHNNQEPPIQLINLTEDSSEVGIVSMSGSFSDKIITWLWFGDGADRIVQLWIFDLTTYELSYLDEVPFPYLPVGQAWSPDNSKIAIGYMYAYGMPYHGYLEIYDLETLEQTQIDGYEFPMGSSKLVWLNDSELQVTNYRGQLPNNYYIENAFPNPFNPNTTIKYYIPRKAYVKITIYDMIGNVIKDLVNENQNYGYKSVQWNATNNQGQPVSAGVYLYSIEAGDFRQTKKMILLK